MKSICTEADSFHTETVFAAGVRVTFLALQQSGLIKRYRSGGLFSVAEDEVVVPALGVVIFVGDVTLLAFKALGADTGTLVADAVRSTSGRIAHNIRLTNLSVKARKASTLAMHTLAIAVAILLTRDSGGLLARGTRVAEVTGTLA